MAHWLDEVLELLNADTSDLRELARLAGADPKIFYRGIDPNKLDLDGQNIAGMEFSPPKSLDEFLDEFVNSELYSTSARPIEIVRTIKRARRQEERSALLLAEFLRDRSRGLMILDQYADDKAAGTNSVIGVLKSVLEEEKSGKKRTELQIARKVSGVFARAEDKRHIVTYYLAKYLHRYPKIKKWLRTKAIHKLSFERRAQLDEWLGPEPPPNFFIPIRKLPSR